MFIVRWIIDSYRRSCSQNNIQNIAESVASIAQLKEDVWEYDLPRIDGKVASVGLDGAYVLIKGEGWREAMSGTISLYDKTGERLHTAYIAASPEYGKQNFHAKMEREITRVRERFPKATMVGPGDGEKAPFFIARTILCQQ